MNELLLTTIKSYWIANRCPPTMRELQRLCSLSSTSVVLKHLRELENDGSILPRNYKQMRVIIPSDLEVRFT